MLDLTRKNKNGEILGYKHTERVYSFFDEKTIPEIIKKLQEIESIHGPNLKCFNTDYGEEIMFIDEKIYNNG